MKQVLIVEDDAHSLSGMIEILDSEGYESYGANSSKDAVHIMITRPVDIVLLDYCLPDMSGLDLCEVLRCHQPDVTIFLITAMYDRTLFCTPQASGIQEIFTKPIVMDELLDKIKYYAKLPMRSST